MGKKKNTREKDLSSINIEELQQIEEVIERSHRDVSVDEHAPLQKKTNNKELLARLLDLERTIFARARQKGVIE